MEILIRVQAEREDGEFRTSEAVGEAVIAEIPNQVEVEGTCFLVSAEVVRP